MDSKNEKDTIIEQQLIFAAKQHEDGMKASDVVRKYSINEATFYNWKMGMDSNFLGNFLKQFCIFFRTEVYFYSF